MKSPRVYCASPSHRAKMWRDRSFVRAEKLDIISTWHENLNFAADDQSPFACAKYWKMDFAQIREADALLAYAEAKDHPNGTLVEIGYAMRYEVPVHLVGSFAWGTWRHCPNVLLHVSLREAAATILGVHPDDPS